MLHGPQRISSHERVDRAPRNTLDQTRSKKRAATRRRQEEAETTTNEFIPSFAVRRQVYPTRALTTALSYLGKDKRASRKFDVYSPENMSLTLFQQTRVIRAFREAGVVPLADEVREIAEEVADELGGLIGNGPKKNLELPVSINPNVRYGNGNSQIGLEPTGYRGGTRKLSQVDGHDAPSPLAIIQQESSIAIEAMIAAYGASGSDTNDGVNLSSMYRMSPHIVVGRKSYASRPREDEWHAMVAKTEQLMPGSLFLEPPVIYLWEERGQQAPIEIYPS